MLTVYLCDDNPSILERYKNMLEKIAEKYNILMQVKTFTSGESLVFYMDDQKELVDIIYLDIIMGETNGIQTAQKLRDMGNSAEIIFLTVNPEYVFDSFDVAPAHYIVKGSISNERFEDIFLKVALRVDTKSNEIFTCSNGSTMCQIPIKEILYFEVMNRIITVHYGEKEFSFYMRMEELEKELKEKNFIRIHRSLLVRLPCIEELKKKSVTLVSKAVLPLGGTYAKNVKTVINRYFSLMQE